MLLTKIMPYYFKMDKLQDVYYQPNTWKGQNAIRKIKELSKEKPKVVKVQMKCFFIPEFERAAKIRKIAIYRFLISLVVPEL